MRLAPSVAADLEEIFKDADVAAAEGKVARSFGARGGSKPPGRGGGARIATLGAVAAAALVGLAAGSLLVKPEPAAKAKALETVRLAAAAPAPAAPAAAKEGYPWSPEPFLPTPAAATPQAEAPAPEPAVVEAPPKPKAKPKPRTPRAAAEPCRGSGCGYANVMAADRRLRAAYDRAARAGVDRAVLVSYRNRWNRLRNRASDEPGRLISGYGAMTVELDRLAADARHASSRRSSSWS